MQEKLGELNDFVASENLIRHYASQMVVKDGVVKDRGDKDQGGKTGDTHGSVDEALRWLKRRKRRRMDRAHALLKRLNAHR